MSAETETSETAPIGSGEGKKSRTVPIFIYYGLCAAFGALFAISGVIKLLDPILFRQQILGYEMIADPYAAVVAVGLPWLELFCGVGLIFGFLRAGSLALLTGLLIVFLIGIFSAWFRGLNIECGCFGGGEKGQYLVWVIRNVVLIGIGVFLLIVEKTRGGDRVG